MKVLKKSDILSVLVLIFSLSVAMLTIIPALFPALYSTTITQSELIELGFYQEIVDPFERGLFFIPIVAASIIVLIIGIFLKTKSPKIPSFEISKKIATVSMVGIIVIFTGISYQEIVSEERHFDWFNLKEGLDEWPPEEFYFHTHVRMFLISSSFVIFGNYKIIPFLASIALLIVTYFFAKKITNNRFAGLISSIIILQSDLFLSFSSIATYTVFWSLFYLISIYMIINRTWYVSPTSYVLALMSKTLVITFLPLSIFFMMNADISTKKKIMVIVSTLIILGSGLILVANPSSYEWDWNEFWIGFTSFSYQMRFDPIIVMFLIPTIIGLFFISRENRYANSISIMISGILLTNPILVGMTTITSQPYRFIPIIIFMAIGMAMIISNKRNLNSLNVKKN